MATPTTAATTGTATGAVATRTVARVVRPSHTLEGAGFPVRRPFTTRTPLLVFVMNTDAEPPQAEEEFARGLMGRMPI
ncbi:hypothetical protein ACFW96_28505 [Streptomyces gardneri]|uniref:hypothetical protein n=1 Tax=Streptomyces gardneri TaxID=66892 RepID=UPI003684B683